MDNNIEVYYPKINFYLNKNIYDLGNVLNIPGESSRSFHDIVNKVHTFDIYALDTLSAPGMGFTIPFGLSVKDVVEIIYYFYSMGNIVKFNPLIDKTDITLYNTMEILKHLIDIINN